MDIIVKVKEVKGSCPTFKNGDSFVLKAGYQLVSDGPVCMHALSSIMPFYNALKVSPPCVLGLEGKTEKDKAYVQCPDPVEYTGGGTVIFEISSTSATTDISAC
jgi:uncharacterized repeat protein (TIGR04076 family)